MNKSLITNLTAIFVILVGLVSPYYSEQILSVGMYSLSGAVTNWLAIHMLFEKVPYLYGSGIIPLKFEAFKAGIRDLIMGQFFSVENLKKFISEEGVLNSIDLKVIIDSVPLDKLFDKLKEAVMSSQLGGMLEMFGGEAALEPMRSSFTVKIKEGLVELESNDTVKKAISESMTGGFDAEELIGKIEQIVDGRLAELTPQKVKEIIQKMIRDHLGWLVVWGGVFGGLIGFFASWI